MFDFLWGTQRKQLDLQSGLAANQSAAATAQAKVASLEQRYERLRLANLGMWELMKQKLGVVDEDLARAVQAIMTEGEGEGRGTRDPQLVPCPSCHRNVLASATTCVYCGAKLTVSAGFGGT